MSTVQLKFFKVTEEPDSWEPNSVYYLKSGDRAFQYVTDRSGEPLLAGDGNAGDAVGLISANTTLSVPGTYATISAAMAYLNTMRIASNATVTIQVADGSYNLSSAVIFTHPDGSRINIIGNTTTPSNCTLTATASNAIFYADNGVTTPFVDGFRLVQSGTKANIGFLVDNGAVGRLGSNVEISNFYYGIAARYGSHIEVSGGNITDRLTVENAGDVGIWAFVGSSINCPYAYVNGADDSANGLGSGFAAEYGGSIQCEFGEATGCYLAGIASFTGSSVRAYDFNSHDNTGYGYYTICSSQITAHRGLSTNNGRYGAAWDWTSIVFASPAVTYSGNTLGATFGDYEIEHPLNVTATTLPATITATQNSATAEIIRLQGDRASATTGDQSYASMYMSDSSGTNREGVRLTHLVADATGASFRSQLLISLATSGALVACYRLATNSISPITNDAATLGISTAGFADLYLASGGRIYHNNSAFDTWGTGSPEGVLTAPVGSTYRRTDGGAATTFYVKESGTGNTGWVGK